MNTLPKIYFTVALIPDSPRVIVSAMAEDGTGLAKTVVDNWIYARYEIGVVGRNFHEIYHNHYPHGWMIVDHIYSSDEELEADVGYMEALLLNAEQDHEETTLDSDSRGEDQDVGERQETTQERNLGELRQEEGPEEEVHPQDPT